MTEPEWPGCDLSIFYDDSNEDIIDKVNAALVKIPSPEWDELQQRRAELISRKNFSHGDLSRDEIKELDFLNSRRRTNDDRSPPTAAGIAPAPHRPR